MHNLRELRLDFEDISDDEILTSWGDGIRAVGRVLPSNMRRINMWFRLLSNHTIETSNKVTTVCEEFADIVVKEMVMTLYARHLHFVFT